PLIEILSPKKVFPMLNMLCKRNAIFICCGAQHKDTKTERLAAYASCKSINFIAKFEQFHKDMENYPFAVCLPPGVLKEDFAAYCQIGNEMAIAIRPDFPGHIWNTA
ncbi:GLOBIN domain-containing protein, partial [Podarcis lilfordi]